MSTPTKWGIIGPGQIAQQFAGDLSLARTPQVIQALCGHSEEGIREFTDKFTVPQVFDDIEKFVREAAIDIAYIATPHHLHYEQAKACLQARIPVLCEKPMTVNDSQSRELYSIARDNKVFLMEGMWIRFLPSIKQVLWLIRENKIGKILAVQASIGFRAPHDPKNRFYDPEKAGGSLLDLGIYPVFLSYILLGKPHSIHAVGKLTPEHIDESTAMLFHYKDDAFAQLTSSLSMQPDRPAEIYGEKGVIRILQPWFEKSAGVELDMYGEGKIVYPGNWPGHGLQFEAEEAAQCVKSGRNESEWMPLSTTLAILEIMDEVRHLIGVKYPHEVVAV